MTPQLAAAALTLLQRAGPAIAFAELDIAAAIRSALTDIAEGRVTVAATPPPKPEVYPGEAAAQEMLDSR